MNTEFLELIRQVSAEKRVPPETILRAIEDALLVTYRRNFGDLPQQDARVEIDRANGEIRVRAKKTVVPAVTDPRAEVSLGEAMRSDPRANLGRSVDVVVTPPDFGRIAAQTVRTGILQKIREHEREHLFSSFTNREGELVAAIVRRIVDGIVVLQVDDAMAVMPRAEQVTGETYRPGQRLRVYIVDVTRQPRIAGPVPARARGEIEEELRAAFSGPQVVVSRTHRNLIRRLFELEVPEVFSGAVEIKAVAREPGSRSKVAVHARQEGVDPVGSCVGMRGTRIQNVVTELRGEKVDVVEWSADPSRFVANALSPAKVLAVEIVDATKTATVQVPEQQLSLAIGREGQNARLAAKLTGWRIDIKAGSGQGNSSDDRPSRATADETAAAEVPT
ncbi:MAG: transcription termination factor NusA [Chloroflexota bacterium]|nr:MAG: transcription termination factor NusA [Chloroflexota bacterium]